MINFHIESERDLPDVKQKMGTYRFEALDPLCAKLKTGDIERDSNYRYGFYDWHEDCYGF